MEYFIQADFKVSRYYPLPVGMTLCNFENDEIVKSYNVKWDTLHILYDNNRQEDIKPIEDPDYSNKFFKRPLDFFPIGKLDNDFFYDEATECCCFRCDYTNKK